MAPNIGWRGNARPDAVVISNVATPSRVMSAATTNATVVLASPGSVTGWHFYNNTGSVKFVKLYNLATTPTSADTPVD